MWYLNIFIKYSQKKVDEAYSWMKTMAPKLQVLKVKTDEFKAFQVLKPKFQIPGFPGFPGRVGTLKPINGKETNIYDQNLFQLKLYEILHTNEQWSRNKYSANLLLQKTSAVQNGNHWNLIIRHFKVRFTIAGLLAPRRIWKEVHNININWQYICTHVLV